MSYLDTRPGRIAALLPAGIVGGAFLLFGAPLVLAAIIAYLIRVAARGE